MSLTKGAACWPPPPPIPALELPGLPQALCMLPARGEVEPYGRRVGGGDSWAGPGESRLLTLEEPRRKQSWRPENPVGRVGGHEAAQPGPGRLGTADLEGLVKGLWFPGPPEPREAVCFLRGPRPPSWVCRLLASWATLASVSRAPVRAEGLFRGCTALSLSVFALEYRLPSAESRAALFSGIWDKRWWGWGR